LYAGFAGDAPRAGEWFEAGDRAEARAGGFALHGAREAVIGARSVWALEDALAASPYILAAMVSGDASERLTAIIFADYDSLVRHAQARAIGFTHYKSLMEAPEIRALIADEVARTAGALEGAGIADFTIADRPLGARDPLLGPAMNLRRRLVHTSFSARGS
ncbi:MAG: long-chain fatty acid--CoA ligase, partial [Rhodoblastus sp.]